MLCLIYLRDAKSFVVQNIVAYKLYKFRKQRLQITNCIVWAKTPTPYNAMNILISREKSTKYSRHCIGVFGRYSHAGYYWALERNLFTESDRVFTFKSGERDDVTTVCVIDARMIQTGTDLTKKYFSNVIDYFNYVKF